MYKIYTYPTCPYCMKVRKTFDEMGIEYEDVNAERGTPGSEELVRLGGSQQVPFLVDGGTMMYESDDIIAYAKKNHSAA